MECIFFAPYKIANSQKNQLFAQVLFVVALTCHEKLLCKLVLDAVEVQIKLN